MENAQYSIFESVRHVTIPRASSHAYYIMQANKISSFMQQALHCSASF